VRTRHEGTRRAEGSNRGLEARLSHEAMRDEGGRRCEAFGEARRGLESGHGLDARQGEGSIRREARSLVKVSARGEGSKGGGARTQRETKA
jgi:hypothetical protein